MDGPVHIDGGNDSGGEATEGSRTRKRDSLFLSARLNLGEPAGTFEVRVRNLSAGGLMAELDRPVDAGTPVTLEMRGLGQLTGRIAWWTRGRVGIALDHPIDPGRARKPVGAGGQTPDYAKPLLISTRR